MTSKNRLFSYLSLYKKNIVLILLLLTVFLVSQAMIPFLVGRYINSSTSIDSSINTLNFNFDISNMIKYIVFILLLVIFGSFSNFFFEYSLSILAQNVIASLRVDIYSKINRIKVIDIESKQVGQFVQYIVNDVESISIGISSVFKQLIQGVLQILITTIFMFCTNYFLSICVIVLSPISLLVSKFVANFSYKSYNENRENVNLLTKYTIEKTNNITSIQSLNYQDKSYDEFSNINSSLKKTSLISQFSSSWTNPVTRLINGFIYALIGISGISFVYFNLFSLRIGDISAFLTYTNGYTKPFNDISSVIGEYETCKIALKNINDFLNMSEDIDSEKELKENINSIEIKDLSFGYTKDKMVLSNINFKVNKNQKVALVGQTGSGKTTLVSLLLRFYEPNSGEILYNGIKSNILKKESLRNHIGMVLQDSWIFYGTVKENICYSSSSNDDKMYQICKEIGADSFINSMENKYDSLISSNSNISDGQKQIITLARVLLDSNDLIILDEATSNIDTRSEVVISNALNKLTKNKTSIIIAHRLSTIVKSDLIIALKDGKIIESGTHNELLKKKGYYYELYQSQFK